MVKYMLNFRIHLMKVSQVPEKLCEPDMFLVRIKCVNFPV